MIEFRFNEEQVKAFRHIISADCINNEILLFLDDSLLPDKEIDDIFGVIYDVIEKAEELVEQNEG